MESAAGRAAQRDDVAKIDDPLVHSAHRDPGGASIQQTTPSFETHPIAQIHGLVGRRLGLGVSAFAESYLCRQGERPCLAVRMILVYGDRSRLVNQRGGLVEVSLERTEPSAVAPQENTRVRSANRQAPNLALRVVEPHRFLEAAPCLLEITQIEMCHSRHCRDADSADR